MKIISIIIILFTSQLLLAQVKTSNPQAQKAAIVEAGNARFTILKPSLIRMEWDDEKQFTDYATLSVVNRQLAAPEFKVKRRGNSLTIRTDELELKYTGYKKFNKENLSVRLIDKNITWHPGQIDTQNLKGTARSLDNTNGGYLVGEKKQLELQDGIISRSGWHLLDDSKTPIFDNSDWKWVQARPDTLDIDWYFFGYGNNYRGAMKDYTDICGAIPMLPDYAFGNWWIRWWSYTQKELKDLVETFDYFKIPLDVLILDMDWHITSNDEYTQNGRKMKDPAGQKFGWTGHTWNKNYFPSPSSFLDYCESRGIKNALNLHPASGIQPHEAAFETMCREMGLDKDTVEYIPFNITDKKYATNYMEHVLDPIEKQGIDFWWLDWQQWSNTTVPGVNPTFYLNYVFYTYHKRNKKTRPILLHRYGGVGNHRYPGGFTGDTWATWKNLEYTRYFVPNAANIGYAYWSDEIGGHGNGWDYENNKMVYRVHDQELYTRYVQFGAFSPLFRTHCTKDHTMIRKFWLQGHEYFTAQRNALVQRFEFMPYIYTAVRKTHESGVAFCHPLYYDYPDDEQVFKYPNQYMFGDDMMVAPIARPIGKDSAFVAKQIYIPKGKWVEWNSGDIIESDGEEMIFNYMVHQTPVFVKYNAILPMQEEVTNVANIKNDPLVFTTWLNEGATTRVYEDAGNDQGYLDNEYTWQKVETSKKENKFNVSIYPLQGDYEGKPEARKYKIQLMNSLPPTQVTINGKPADWEYDASGFKVIVPINETSTSETINVKISVLPDNSMLQGMKMKIDYLHLFGKKLSETFDFHTPTHYYDKIMYFGQLDDMITEDPEEAVELIQSFNKNWEEMLSLAKVEAEKHSRLKKYYELLETVK